MDISKLWEKQVITNYSGLEKKYGKFIDTWGFAYYQGEVINVYSDPVFIRDLYTRLILSSSKNIPNLLLADFGSAEGHVAHTVSSQLHEQGLDVTPLGLDRNDKSLALMKAKFPLVRPVMADLAALPLPPYTVDAGILRFVLPYFGKADQSVVLKQVFDTLKKGATLVVMQDGAFTPQPGALYNDFFAEATAAIGGWSVADVKEQRHFPSCLEVQEAARKIGFCTIKGMDLMNIAVGYFSPKSYTCRFGLTDDQKAKLTSVFRRWQQQGTLPFQPGTLRIRRSMFVCVLKK